MQPQLEQVKPTEIHTWSRNVAFGAIPQDIIDLVKANNDDRIVKLRCIEDLDYVLTNLKDPQNEVDLTQLLNYSSSFVQFIEEYLLEDTYQDIKVIFTAIKAIKLVILSEKVNAYSKIITRLNLKRLVGTLLLKLNDPKEIIRNEVERLIILISDFMSTKELVLQLLATFRLQDKFNDAGQ